MDRRDGTPGGDELNRIQREGNYGYLVVSKGDHYDGREMPDHDTRPRIRTVVEAARSGGWKTSATTARGGC